MATTEYQKWSIGLKIAENAQFNPHKFKSEIDDYKPDGSAIEYESRDISAATGGTTIDLSTYTTVDNIIVKNKDVTNYVTAKFRTGDGGAVDIQLRVEAGDFIKTGGDVTIANDIVLTANGAACECEVIIQGT